MEYSPIALALLNQATDTRLPRDKPGMGATLSDMMLQQAQQQSTQADADAKRYALNEERRTQEMLKGMDLSDPALPKKLLSRGEPILAAKVMQMQAKAAPSSTIGKIQADIDAGLISPEVGAAALKKATTIAPVYDPVTQRLIYAGGEGFNAPQASGMPAPSPAPAVTAPDYYSGAIPEPTQVPVPAELPDDSANLVEQALAQIPPILATENPALYQKMASDLTKDIPKQKQTMIGKKKFESSINQLEDVLRMGMEKGFLTSENKSLTQNILNRGFATEYGKLAADFIGNDRATFLQVVDGVRSSITTNMMQAYGLGATQLNTLREMEMLLKQAVNGTLTEQASKKLIGLMREREGFAPRTDIDAAKSLAAKRGIVQLPNGQWVKQ